MSNRKMLIVSALICFAVALVFLAVFFIVQNKLFLTLGGLWFGIGGIVLISVKLEDMTRHGRKK